MAMLTVAEFLSRARHLPLRTRVVVSVLACIAAGSLADVVRSLLPAVPCDIDRWEPTAFHHLVRVEGIPHLESSSGYSRVWTYAQTNQLVPDMPVRSWLLVPLNKPTQEGASLAVAEVTLDEGEKPIGFNPDDAEFVGLLGPMPRELITLTRLPHNRPVARLQVGVRLSVLPAVLVLLWALAMIRFVVRLDLGHAGLMSCGLLLVSAGYLFWYLSLRVLASPEANDYAPCVFGVIAASCGLGVYLLFSRPSLRTLTNEEFNEAAASHEKLLR